MTDHFVRPTNGNDSNNGLTFANAFKTTAKLITVEAAGDDAFISNEADELVTTGMITVASGTRESPIRWIAADTVDGSPLNGSGQYTISCNLSVGNDAIDINADTFRLFQDIRITRTAGGADEAWRDDGGSNTFIRCQADGGWVSGFELAGDVVCTDCEAFGCTNGFITSADCQILACRSHDNVTDGFRCGSTESTFVDCAAWDNTNGFDTEAQQGNTFYKCLAFGNSGDGFNINNSDHNTVVNCSSSGNGGFGYNYTGGGSKWTITFGYNHAFNNTSGETNESGAWADQGLGGNIVGDPLFESVVDGSEDFTPKSGSPLIDAGFPQGWGMTTVGNMGPLKEDTSGGGGGDIRTKRLKILGAA